MPSDLADFLISILNFSTAASAIALKAYAFASGEINIL
jgi:hypothetical protein